MRRNKRLELKSRLNGSTHALLKFRELWELLGVIGSSLFSALGRNIPLFMSIYDSSLSGAFDSNRIHLKLLLLRSFLRSTYV